jgi:hypothetical protein
VAVDLARAVSLTVLVAAFVWAAVAKLADRAGTRRAAAGLGTPPGLEGAVAAVLPATELAAAGLLAVPPSRAIGAMVVLALLAVFSTAVALSLRAGRRPVCHCFGARSDRPIGPDTLARNGALAALALVLLVT